MQKKYVRLIAVILAAILACSVFAGALATVARAASVSELKDKHKEIEQEIQEIESEIDSLEEEQANTIQLKERLDEQISATQKLIDNIAEQIKVYDELIAEKEKEVAAAQAKEDEQYDLYKSRIRTMEENGTISYYEIIFGATSFSDLLARIEMISEIMTYDETVYEAYVVAKQETIAAKEELEEANELQKETKAEQEAREAELLADVEEASSIIADLESNIEKYKETYDELQKEEDRIQKDINDMLAASSSNSSSGGSGVQGDGVVHGSLTWPAPASRLITSKFGTRFHPVYKEYRTHTGVDIGASYGSNVLAANGGTVTTATYSNSYGYYIVINHHNGMTTLYAHMSKLIASVGDTVSAGQVIGLVGSTGVSTGPHLHFEVSVNGTRVNPLDYFSNYTIK